jgi:hypothetical protein
VELLKLAETCSVLRQGRAGDRQLLTDLRRQLAEITAAGVESE